MKTATEFLNEVENQYNVEDIKINNFQIWQVLRSNFLFDYYNNIYLKNILQKNINLNKQKSKNQIKSIFHNFYKIMFNYDTWIFTYNIEKRFDISKNNYIDKLSNNIINYYKDNALVFFSLNNTFNSTNKNMYIYKNYINTYIITNFLPKLFKIKSFEIINENILKQILFKYKLRLNYKLIITEFYTYVNCFNFIFKFKKPKMIFLSNYYNTFYQALIYSAKLNNIKVIELQHGIISQTHHAYNINKNIGNQSFPEYIFTFGNYYTKFLKHNFIPEENIFSIGNFYLNDCLLYNSNNKYLKNKFKCFRKNYNKIVLVTGQINYEKRMLNFLNDTANIDRNILYIFLPRFYTKEFELIKKYNNIQIEKDLNFYQMISFCDYHATISSTCFLEALKSGKPSILININGRAKEDLFNEFQDDGKFVYINSPKEMTDIIINYNFDSEQTIKQYAKVFYKDNYNNNMVQALNKIEQSINNKIV